MYGTHEMQLRLIRVGSIGKLGPVVRPIPCPPIPGSIIYFNYIEDISIALGENQISHGRRHIIIAQKFSFSFYLQDIFIEISRVGFRTFQPFANKTSEKIRGLLLMNEHPRQFLKFMNI